MPTPVGVRGREREGESEREGEREEKLENDLSFSEGSSPSLSTFTLPPASRRRSFWQRRRGGILTAGLVLYTVALAVAIGDDVLHLGLFHTELEREARGLIRQFDDPDAMVRREAVEKLVRDNEPFVAVPELIRALGSASEVRRGLAAECLRRITGANQGFAAAAPPPARQDAIARWRQWWKDNQQHF